MSDNNINNGFPGPQRKQSNNNGGFQGWLVAALIIIVIGFLIFSRTPCCSQQARIQTTIGQQQIYTQRSAF
ncbi:MAG: hypothetical protein MUF45_18485 [Spirosomaceae bacterium]|nr:hypothetical protein [Spirosomataceae bacterium]